MKKIILALDGENFSRGAFEFARRLNEVEPILLTGVVLPQARVVQLWTLADAMGNPMALPAVELAEPTRSEKSIAVFEKLCVSNDIDYRLHRMGYNFTLAELKKESRYADVLILGSQSFFEEAGTSVPNEYLRQALHHVKCPVILVPERFDFPEIILLAYDGSDDSVFAIKQFSYLFPQLCKQQTTLVYAQNDPGADFPDKIQIEELVARHFSDLSLHKLDMDPKRDFAGWIHQMNSALLVCGSYGRSGLSQLFAKSFVHDIIARQKLPIFIAHR